MQFKWSRWDKQGYEVSSKGDSRFSALFAGMPDGRTIEQWYQCDVKGYQPGGRDWRLGKGKPSLLQYPEGHLWLMYLSLWRLWTLNNMRLMSELREQAIQHNHTLTDCFATTPVNQAHALATILTEW